MTSSIDLEGLTLEEQVIAKQLEADVIARRRILQECAEQRSHPILESIYFYPAW